MVRFRCVHCGGRIAVQDNHLDRLARCPECGGVTHPLAAHLATPGDAGTSKSAAPIPLVPEERAVAEPDVIRCDNCGEPLGRLQKPQQWQEHLVCGPCYRMLSLEASKPAGEPSGEMALRSPEGDQGQIPAVINGAPGGSLRMADFATAARGAFFGLCAAAAALYILVTVLQSLNILIVWALGSAAVIAAFYWVRRRLLAIRDARFPSRRRRRVEATVRE